MKLGVEHENHCQKDDLCQPFDPKGTFAIPLSVIHKSCVVCIIFFITGGEIWRLMFLSFQPGLDVVHYLCTDLQSFSTSLSEMPGALSSA